MLFLSPRSAFLLVVGITTCAFVGCSSGEIRLLPGAAESNSGGSGGSLGVETGGAPEGGAPPHTAGTSSLPPLECLDARCETLDCINDVECREECAAQLLSCATGCANENECPANAPFCDPELDRCVRCTQNTHCLLLYKGLRSVCTDGLCLPCQANSECPDGLECRGGACGDCSVDEDCGNNERCVDLRCQKD